jgi:hypothetical protein
LHPVRQSLPGNGAFESSYPPFVHNWGQVIPLASGCVARRVKTGGKTGLRCSPGRRDVTGPEPCSGVRGGAGAFSSGRGWSDTSIRDGVGGPRKKISGVSDNRAPGAPGVSLLSKPRRFPDGVGLILLTSGLQSGTLSFVDRPERSTLNGGCLSLSFAGTHRVLLFVT